MTPTSNLREEIRNRRRRLGYGRQILAARTLTHSFTQLPEFKDSQKIALYWAVDGELSCHLLIKHCWKQGKECYLPVIDTENLSSRTMYFCQYRPGVRLKANRLGLLEPTNSKQCAAQDLDIVVTPMVAFDHHGSRIGMGGGFYDKNFAFKQKDHLLNYPIMIGVAHQCQQLHYINPNKWDLRMDKVIAV